MRIAYICADPGIPVYGHKGASIHVQEVIRSFVRGGARVELFATQVGGTAPPGLESVVCHQLPCNKTGTQSHREQLALAANAALKHKLQSSGQFDLIYERYSLWSFAGMDYAHSTHTPGILEVNAPLIEEQATHRSLINRTEAQQVAERVFDTADGLIAVSDGVADFIRGYVSNPNRIAVIPNGVDPERFTPDRQQLYSRSSGDFVVGFVGTLKPWHGLDILIDAFDEFAKNIPNAKLLVVGDGPQREDLQARLSVKQLCDRTHFVGSVNHDEIPGYLTSMNVAVAPYPNIDGFYFSPLKILEYMASGLAIAASKIGQINDLLSDGVSGLLCVPGDPHSLAAALLRLHADCDLRHQLGHTARHIVLKQYTWDAVAGRILELAGFPQTTVFQMQG